MSRLFGGTLFAIAIIQWMARDFDTNATRAVLMGVGVADAINCIIAIAATTSGTINALGWSTVLIYLVGALGAGYFLMNPDKRSASKSRGFAERNQKPRPRARRSRLRVTHQAARGGLANQVTDLKETFMLVP